MTMVHLGTVYQKTSLNETQNAQIAFMKEYEDSGSPTKLGAS